LRVGLDSGAAHDDRRPLEIRLCDLIERRRQAPGALARKEHLADIGQLEFDKTVELSPTVFAQRR
jgi:hypothetical protein